VTIAAKYLPRHVKKNKCTTIAVKASKDLPVRSSSTSTSRKGAVIQGGSTFWVVIATAHWAGDTRTRRRRVERASGHCSLRTLRGAGAVTDGKKGKSEACARRVDRWWVVEGARQS
jgi:hypothetical protein